MMVTVSRSAHVGHVRTVVLGVLGVIGRIPVASVLTATTDLGWRPFLSVNLGVVSVLGRLRVDSSRIATKEFGNAQIRRSVPARYPVAR
jgi:hypothetical protein